MLLEHGVGGEDAERLVERTLQLGWTEAHLSRKAAVPCSPGPLPREQPGSEVLCTCVTPVSPSLV